MVAFRQKNLLSPDFVGNQQPYDVIFCRNLLIYFDRPTQGLLMTTLARLLSPGGFLFVGPAEAFLASCNGFKSVNRAMSFAFRKVDAREGHSQRSLSGSRKRATSQPRPSSPQVTPAISLSPAVAISPTPARNDLEKARSLADAGRLQEAAAWCEANLAEQGPSSETFFLFGLIRDAMGDRNGAAAFYRKVIYLDPGHVEALMQLALVSETQGDVAAAERLRARARRVAGVASATGRAD